MVNSELTVRIINTDINNILGCEFPWSNIEKKLKLFYGRLKHKIRFFMCRDGFKDKESVYAQFYDDVSECLYHFSVITSVCAKA